MLVTDAAVMERCSGDLSAGDLALFASAQLEDGFEVVVYGFAAGDGRVSFRRSTAASRRVFAMARSLT